MNRWAWLVPAILWVDIGFLLAVATVPAPAQRSSPCECESLRDTVTRNGQQITENTHDIRELEAWRDFISKTTNEHGIDDAVKFAQLRTTVDAHDRLFFVLFTIIAGVLVEIFYRQVVGRMKNGQKGEAK